MIGSTVEAVVEVFEGLGLVGGAPDVGVGVTTPSPASHGRGSLRSVSHWLIS